MNVLKFHQDCSRVITTATFDEKLRKLQLFNEIYLQNSDWVCNYPYFMQYVICKHVISFKINVMIEAVPPQHDATDLYYRKKSGRPKKAPSTLTIDSS